MTLSSYINLLLLLNGNKNGEIEKKIEGIVKLNESCSTTKIFESLFELHTVFYF